MRGIGHRFYVTISDFFFKELTQMQQIFWLFKNKQNKLVAGENVVLHDNPDHTTTITADATSAVPHVTATVQVDDTTGTPSATVTRSGEDIEPNFDFAFSGLKGEAGQNGRDGTNGTNGRDGTDGFSPTATVTQTIAGADISITDKNGTTTATVHNGTDGTNGTDGADGFSPTATVTQTSTGADISITDKNGTTTATVHNGTDGTNGTDGADGFSPTATVTQTSTGADISITDKNGTTTASITSAKINKAATSITVQNRTKIDLYTGSGTQISSSAQSGLAVGNLTGQFINDGEKGFCNLINSYPCTSYLFRTAASGTTDAQRRLHRVQIEYSTAVNLSTFISMYGSTFQLRVPAAISVGNDFYSARLQSVVLRSIDGNNTIQLTFTLLTGTGSTDFKPYIQLAENTQYQIMVY